MIKLPEDFNMRGITGEGNRLVVSFVKRRAWFTDKEEEILKNLGVISLFGYFNNQQNNCNFCCCGENDLFENIEELKKHIQDDKSSTK